MYNTKPRKEILKLFQENKNELYTPKMIMELLSSNKATVYRTLEMLYDEGILNRFFDERTNTFQYQYIDENDNCSTHLHLKCLVCGKIIHLNCHDANHLINHINLLHGFNVDQKQTIIYGTCKACSGRLI